MKLVIWLNSLDEHQVHTLRELGRRLSERILFIVVFKNLQERHEQGWGLADLKDLDVIEIPKNGFLQFCYKQLKINTKAIHLFGGMWGSGIFPIVIVGAKFLQIKTGLISEPFSDKALSYYGQVSSLKDKFKVVLRWFLYYTLGALIVRSMSVVFAISRKAIDQYKSMGCTKEKLFPYGYFVPFIPTVKFSRQIQRQLRLIFVGSLIERKGIDVLHRAMKRCNDVNAKVTLDVFGPGIWRSGIWGSKNIFYKGIIPFGEAQHIISGYDVMVLPSKHDGWGVVVNEALLQGVPVIASDAVGSSVLIESSGAGAIFRSEDDEDLASIILFIISNKNVVKKWQDSAISIRSAIQPSIAAKYLHESLQYISNEKKIKPVASWYKRII